MGINNVRFSFVDGPFYCCTDELFEINAIRIRISFCTLINLNMTFFIVQKTMIALRAPDYELWSCLGKVASVNADMNESYQCIDRLDKIT